VCASFLPTLRGSLEWLRRVRTALAGPELLVDRRRVVPAKGPGRRDHLIAERRPDDARVHRVFGLPALVEHPARERVPSRLHGRLLGREPGRDQCHVRGERRRLDVRLTAAVGRRRRGRGLARLALATDHDFVVGQRRALVAGGQHAGGFDVADLVLARAPFARRERIDGEKPDDEHERDTHCKLPHGELLLGKEGRPMSDPNKRAKTTINRTNKYSIISRNCQAPRGIKPYE